MNINRRDTIIIATLCNIFVLICIFGTAKTEKQSQIISKDTIQESEHSRLSVKQAEQSLKSLNQAQPSSPDEILSFFETKNGKNESLHEEEPHSFDEIDLLLEEYEPVVTKKEATTTTSPKLKNSSEQKKEPTTSSIPQKKKSSLQVSPSDRSIPKSENTTSSLQKDLKTTRKERKVYIVQPGDNPWTIAKKCKISVESLLLLNKLDEVKAKNLKIGQVLLIEQEVEREEDDLNTHHIQKPRLKK